MPVNHAGDDYSFAPAVGTPLSVSVTPYSKRVIQNTDVTAHYVSRYSAEESSDAAYQVDLQNRRFQLRKRRVIMVSLGVLSFCMISMLVRVQKILGGINVSGFTIRMPGSYDSVASRDSDGFFADISADDWKKRAQQTKTVLREQDALNAVASPDEPATWWLKNWQTNFQCHQEVQINGKYICDPFRLVAQAVEYVNSGGKAGKECIVYVSGGDEVQFGNQFLDYTLARVMEVGLTTPVCDVHLFHPNLQISGSQQRDNLVAHSWGFKPKLPVNNSTGAAFKTIEDTMQELGHTDKAISVLALDCEQCEWDIYHDILSVGSSIHQLLIQMHGVPNPNAAHSMFNAMRANGYVITHKEDEPHGNGEVYDYSFLKLSETFFN